VTLTLVLGGARSGKSAWAERRAGGSAGSVTYVATGDGAEMPERVAAHRARRPAAWATVETTDLMGVLPSIEGTVLVDSLTAWVAAAPGFTVDVDWLCRALSSRAADTVVVSDEVGLGVHPSSEAGRSFRDALGLVNQAVAAVADEVLLVIAGRALVLEQA
jgi:adenosylcobinamide kinase/adenosylcobinamide-phosphate guanylyltransferase